MRRSVRHCRRMCACVAVFLATGACDTESPGPIDSSEAGPSAGGHDAGSGEPANGGSGGRRPRPNTGGKASVPTNDDAGTGGAPPEDAAPTPTGSGGRTGSDGAADASPPPEDTGAPCTKTTLYADSDGDGFGDAAQVFVGCQPPADEKWTEVAGDCNDGNADVHPTQAAFFGVPHEQPGSEPSYDYDCSGTEEPDPSQPLAPTSCGVLSLALCSGEGHVSTTRSGQGLDAHCGSKMKTTCRAALGILVCEAITAPTEVPFRCR